MSATLVSASFSAETLSCTPSDGGCLGSQHTFVWQRPPTFDCPLQVVRTVIMHRQPGSTIYVSKDSMLAVEIKGEPTPIGTCPGEWHATQETRLKAYMGGHPIGQPTAGMSTLHSEEVDPFILLAMLRDYLALANASRIAEVSELDQISLCRRQLAAADQRSTL